MRLGLRQLSVAAVDVAPVVDGDDGDDALSLVDLGDDSEVPTPSDPLAGQLEPKLIADALRALHQRSVRELDAGRFQG